MSPPSEVSDATIAASVRVLALGERTASEIALLASVTFIVLGIPDWALAGFATFAWTLGYALMILIHRRYLAVRGRLPKSLMAFVGRPTQWMQLREPAYPVWLDPGLYASLLAIGFISTVLWWPSLFALPGVYAASIYMDQRVLRIRSAEGAAVPSDRAWVSLAIYHPVANFPLLVAWFGNPDNLGLGLLALLFWIGQAAMFILLLNGGSDSTGVARSDRHDYSKALILALSGLLMGALVLFPNHLSTWLVLGILLQLVLAAIGPRWLAPQRAGAFGDRE